LHYNGRIFERKRILKMENFKFDDIEEAINDFKNGKMIIVADDEDRENEGDIICSAQCVTPETIKFMAEKAKGLICLAISKDIADKMKLPQMVEQNSESMKTAFTISIDADEKYGVTTGISAYDRAKTIEVCIAPDAQPADLRRPGHLFPCVSREGGVLTRTGHTEAVVDLARLSGHIEAGAMCEIMSESGYMAKRDELYEFAKKYNLKFISVAQLIAYRLKSEKIVIRDAQAHLLTQYGEFDIYGYTNKITGQESVALVKDDGSDKIPMIRVHSECLTGDIFGSLKCDCNYQLHSAMKMIDEYGSQALNDGMDKKIKEIRQSNVWNKNSEEDKISAAEKALAKSKNDASASESNMKNALYLASAYRSRGENKKSAEMYLNAAKYSRQAGNEENAARSFYGAIESFDAAALYADAKATFTEMKKLYPESKYTKDAEKIAGEL